MSSTPKGERRPLDAYYTPDDVAARCVAVIPGGVRGLLVWEPSVGGGAFLRALEANGAQVWTSDINPEIGARVTGDALAIHPPPETAWTIGNPPFSDAEAHVRHALSRTPGVAFLLRLAFLESIKRRPLWQAHPPAAVYVLSERPSFTGGATDSAAYGFFIWHRAHVGAPILGWL
jgi:hypothetical protein